MGAKHDKLWQKTYGWGINKGCELSRKYGVSREVYVVRCAQLSSFVQRNT